MRSKVELEVLPSVAAVPAETWDAMASPDDPFTTHAFLHALESSGSAAARTGWVPCHLLLREAGEAQASLPLYRKAHSHGEYIFDWAWAEAAERAGLRYYPKLLSAVPFTPATGPRLRLRPDLPPDRANELRRLLLRAAVELARAQGDASVHLLFCTRQEAELAASEGFIPRQTMQFHWLDAGYRDFDGWLAAFRSKRRKEVRRERRLPEGVTVLDLPGAALDAAQRAAIRALYLDTCEKRGGYPYLRAPFFEALGRELPCRALLAVREGEVLAMSLLFSRGASLFGRYWGCRPGHEGLHFELCYHRPIEICLREGFRRFEAGAQGIHKLPRGLLPATTWSAHQLFHGGLHRAVQEACREEAAQLGAHMAALAAQGPFHRPGGESDEAS